MRELWQKPAGERKAKKFSMIKYKKKNPKTGKLEWKVVKRKMQPQAVVNISRLLRVISTRSEERIGLIRASFYKKTGL